MNEEWFDQTVKTKKLSKHVRTPGVLTPALEDLQKQQSPPESG